MHCSNCGGDNREGAKFCRHCGALLTEPKAETPVGAVEAGAAHHEASEPELDRPAMKEPVSGGLGSEVETTEVWNGEPEAKVGEVSPDAATEAEPQVETEVPPDEEQGPETDLPEEAILPPAVGAEAMAAPSLEGRTVIDDGAVSAVAAGETAASVPIPAGAEPGGELAEEAATAEEVGGPALGLLPAPPAEVGRASPLPEGTMIADRFLVIDTLDVQESEVLYLARDLKGCWQCGFEGNAPSDAFCAQCGALLEQRNDVRLVEVRGEETMASRGKAVAERLLHQGRVFLLLAEPEAETPPAPSVGIRLVVGQRSDPGQVRDLNEDSLLAVCVSPVYESKASPMLGLFAVADGMGGHEGGEVASRLALRHLADQVLDGIILPEIAGQSLPEDAILERLRQATVAANDAVYLARQKAGSDMGTTLTIALVRDGELFLAHVGDSRAYRWSSAGLDQLTADHSLIASMVAGGQAQPDEIYTHPHRSIIYRCIGDKPVVEVDTRALQLAPDDRIIVCSDGLWEMIRNEGVEDVMMQESDPQVACDLLVSRANMAGGEDNVSVLVVHVMPV